MGAAITTIHFRTTHHPNRNRCPLAITRVSLQPSRSQETSDLLSVSVICLFWTSRGSGIMHYAALSNWLLAFSIMFSGFIPAVLWPLSLFNCSLQLPLLNASFTSVVP